MNDETVPAADDILTAALDDVFGTEGTATLDKEIKTLEAAKLAAFDEWEEGNTSRDEYLAELQKLDKETRVLIAEKAVAASQERGHYDAFIAADNGNFAHFMAAYSRRMRAVASDNRRRHMTAPQILEYPLEPMDLQSAARDFASSEVKIIAQSVIESMRGRPALGMFGDVAARHMWDEYCWSLQHGPFDDDMGWDDLRIGSLSGGFEEVAYGLIQTELDKRSPYALIFLSTKAFENDPDHHEDDCSGVIWPDGIVTLVTEELNDRASNRNLDLIGPDRGELVYYEVNTDGMVWSVLSNRGEASEILASHCDALLDPDDDLSDLATEMLDAFMAAAAEEEEGEIFPVILQYFEDNLRTLVMEKDILPALEGARTSLLRWLDR